MKDKKYYYIQQGEKVGAHTLIEHLNEHSKTTGPFAKFKCGKCGLIYKTTIRAAYKSKSCGCAKIKHHIKINDVIEVLKIDPFIRVKVLADYLGVSYATAWTHRKRAFRLL